MIEAINTELLRNYQGVKMLTVSRTQLMAGGASAGLGVTLVLLGCFAQKASFLAGLAAASAVLLWTGIGVLAATTVIAVAMILSCKIKRERLLREISERNPDLPLAFRDYIQNFSVDRLEVIKGLSRESLEIFGGLSPESLEIFGGLSQDRLDVIRQLPMNINELINFRDFRDVSISHLLCSGKFFLEAAHEMRLEEAYDELNDAHLELTLALIRMSLPNMAFSIIDHSNLWERIFGGNAQGSGNNVLKTAVSAAAAFNGKVSNRAIVQLLLESERFRNLSLEDRRAILDARDNYGGPDLPIPVTMNIPEFLLREGNENLVLEAVRQGAPITDKLLINAAASAGTTEHGTDLLNALLETVQNEPREFTKETRIKTVVSLMAVEVDENSEAYCKQRDLIVSMGLYNTEKDATALLNFWRSINFYDPRGVANGIKFDWHVFGEFSGDYRAIEGERVAGHYIRRSA